ncbi:NADAR domain-containing protein [Streptomyces sp. NPDC051954]|uniref:NADAR domain-containing protein n=1 Tax=Streptomyces sp. NPDC051954 TaxID=3155524 RepID=UPI00342E96C3
MGKIDAWESLVREVRAGARVKYLHFWGHRAQRDGRVDASCLSQWWPSPFVVDGVPSRPGVSCAASKLVEASPLDRVWGIGLAADDPAAMDPERWRGPNLLGFALMGARERLVGGGG